MTGVDDGGRPGAQVDAADLAGHEAALWRVVGEPFAGEACLLGESDAGPARVAQAADHERGEQRGSDLVAHGVGQREVQHAPLQREVEGVAADVAGGLQPARERELPGLARVGARQQPCWISAASERGTERWPHSKRSVNRRLAMTTYARACAANATSASTCSSGASPRRSSSTPMASPRLVTGANTRVPSAPCSSDDRLGGQRAPGRASHQRHPLGGLVTLRARGRAVAGVAEPDQRVAAEVRDEERNLAGVQLARKTLAENVGSGERRSVLNGREQLRKVQPR